MRRPLILLTFLALSVAMLQAAPVAARQPLSLGVSSQSSTDLAAVDPMLALERIRARQQSEHAFAQIDQGASWYRDASSAGTVGAGLLALGRWLSKKV